MAYFVEKLGLGDVIEERGLMEPSQFNARGGACPRRELLSMSRYGPRSGMLKGHSSKRLRSTSFPPDGEVEFFNWKGLPRPAATLKSHGIECQD